MKLEDATKEELIWWIKEHSFALSFRPSEFEADIMRHRHDVYMEKADKCGEQYDEALKSYQTLLTPYLGKPLGLLPKRCAGPGRKAGKDYERRPAETDAAMEPCQQVHGPGAGGDGGIT